MLLTVELEEHRLVPQVTAGEYGLEGLEDLESAAGESAPLSYTHRNKSLQLQFFIPGKPFSFFHLFQRDWLKIRLNT